MSNVNHEVTVKFNTNTAELKRARAELKEIQRQIDAIQRKKATGDIGELKAQAKPMQQNIKGLETQRLQIQKEEQREIKKLLAHSTNMAKETKATAREVIRGQNELAKGYRQLAKESERVAKLAKEPKMAAPARDPVIKQAAPAKPITIAAADADRGPGFGARTKRALGQSFLEAPLYSASFALMAGLGLSIQKFMELDKIMTRIGIVTGRSAESMKIFAEYANDAGKSLGVTGQRFSEASLIFLQQGGLAADYAADLAKATIQLANITGQNADDISEDVTAIANSFNLLETDGSQAGKRIVDMLAVLEAQSGSSADEISKAFKKSASSFEAAGFSMEEAASILTVILEKTRQAPELVGTGMKTIIGNLSEVRMGSAEFEGITSKLQDVSKEFGLMFSLMDEGTGEIKKIPAILTEISYLYNRTTDEAAKRALVEAVAGKEQRDRFLALVSSEERLAELLKASQNSAGAAQAAQERYLESIAGKVEQVKNEWEDLVMNLISSDAFKGLLDQTTTVLSNINRMIESGRGFVEVLKIMATLLGPIAAMKIFSGLGGATAAAAGMSFGQRMQYGALGKAQKEQFQANPALRPEILKAGKANLVGRVGAGGGIAAAIGVAQLPSILGDSSSGGDKLLKTVGALAPAIGSVFGPLGILGGLVVSLGINFITADKELAKFKDGLDAMASTAKESLTSSAKEVDALVGLVTNTGIDKTTDEYITSVSRLIELVPELAVGEDMYGNAILMSNQNLIERIALLKEQRDIELEIEGQTKYEELGTEVGKAEKNKKTAENNVLELQETIDKQIAEVNFINLRASKVPTSQQSSYKASLGLDSLNKELKQNQEDLISATLESQQADKFTEALKKKRAIQYANIMTLSPEDKKLMLEGLNNDFSTFLADAASKTKEDMQEYLENNKSIIIGFAKTNADGKIAVARIIKDGLTKPFAQVSLEIEAGLRASGETNDEYIEKFIADSEEHFKKTQLSLIGTFEEGEQKTIYQSYVNAFETEFSKMPDVINSVASEIEKSGFTYSQKIAKIAEVTTELAKVMDIQTKFLNSEINFDEFNSQIAELGLTYIKVSKMIGLLPSGQFGEVPKVTVMPDSLTSTKPKEEELTPAELQQQQIDKIKKDQEIKLLNLEATRARIADRLSYLEPTSKEGLAASAELIANDKQRININKTMISQLGKLKPEKENEAAILSKINSLTSENFQLTKANSDAQKEIASTPYTQQLEKLNAAIAIQNAELALLDPLSESYVASLKETIVQEKNLLSVIEDKNLKTDELIILQKKLAIQQYEDNLAAAEEVLNRKSYVDETDRLVEKIEDQERVMSMLNKSSDEYTAVTRNIIQSQKELSAVKIKEIDRLSQEIELTEEQKQNLRDLQNEVIMLTDTIKKSATELALDEFNIAIFGTADISELQKKYEINLKYYDDLIDAHEQIIERGRIELDIQQEIESSTDETYKTNLKYLKTKLQDTKLTTQQINATRSQIDLLKALSSSLSTTQNQFKLTRSPSGGFRFAPEASATTEQSKAQALEAAVGFEQKSIGEYRRIADEEFSAIQEAAMYESMAAGASEGSVQQMEYSERAKTLRSYIKSLEGQRQAQGKEIERAKVVSSLVQSGQLKLASRVTSGQISAQEALKSLSPERRAGILESIEQSKISILSPEVVATNKLTFTIENLIKALDNLKTTVKENTDVSRTSGKGVATPGSTEEAANYQRLLNDPTFVKSEITRAKEVIAYRDSLNLDTEGQKAYLDSLNAMVSNQGFTNNSSGLKNTKETDNLSNSINPGGIYNPYIPQMESGGYTGDSSGLAVLHEKEIVLNKLDTSRILEAVRLVRSMPNMINSPVSESSRQSSSNNQNVTINAEFPNVTSADQIKAAFASMSSRALQYAYSKKSY
jgi:TP901 family phage tail tape measure protein